MRLLIIEDDKDLCEAMCFHLKQADYTVDFAYDGNDGLHFALQAAYDVILLDRLLPGLDGLHLLKKLRNQGITTPVLMVTALSDISDRVIGLDTGADDYLTKPFATEELLARVRALSRRPAQLENHKLLSYEDLSLNLETFILSGPTRSCTLSKREADIATFFLHHPNLILSRNQILVNIWGPDAPIEDGNIDNYIYFLRRRLRTVGSVLTLKTHRGIGYSLEVNHA